MNSSLQFACLESSLQRLQARIPDLPLACVLLSRLLIHLGRGMTGLLEQQIRPFGLVEAEFRVLTTLFSQPDGVAHPSELCLWTSQSAANMSRISDALVDRQLITRVHSTADRRKMVLRITSQGEDLVSHIVPALNGPLREVTQDLSPDDQQLLIHQLKSLNAKLDNALACDLPERSG